MNFSFLYIIIRMFARCKGFCVKIAPFNIKFSK